MIENIMVYIFIFITGTVFGSFFNVLIYRIPNELSIIKPASRCGQCLTPLKWYDLIPVISYLSLKGKCRYCGTRISVRYALVEVLTGILTLITFIFFGPTFDFIFYISLIYVLIPCFFIDLDHMIIPNGLLITGSIFLILGTIYKAVFLTVDIKDLLLGSLAGGGILLIIYILGLLIYKKEALGFGDVKLFLMIGAFLGLKLTLIGFLLSIFTGAVAGIIILIKTKKGGQTEMPFGPFIVSGSILSLFIGSLLYNWYMGFIL